MKTKSDWNPSLYLKFDEERSLAATDLIRKIRCTPKTILDVGCGPGNTREHFLEKWPSVAMTGVDSSPAMIEKASKDFPQSNWILADVSLWHSERTYDLVFSNAVIQWIPDHQNLLNKLFSCVSEGGGLAVHFPNRYITKRTNVIIKRRTNTLAFN